MPTSSRNDRFRRDVLELLGARGRVMSRDIPDTHVEPWPSSGWTNNRNVTQMLELLGMRGEVAIAGRQGRQRLWDLAERVYPAGVEVVAREEARRIRDERRLRALDRARTADLFGFDYALEMYKPAAKRPWGYFALPILHHDRLAGKLDATADREAGVLRVNAVHEDIRFRHAIAAEVEPAGARPDGRRYSSSITCARRKERHADHPQLPGETARYAPNVSPNRSQSAGIEAKSCSMP